MNAGYYTASPLARRATVPISMAPTASMIDPSLDQYSMDSLHQQPSQQQQQQQQQPSMMRNPNLQAPAQNTVQNGNQLQSPMKTNGRINSPNNHFSPQRAQNNQTPTSDNRQLPSQQITDQTLDDAYVQFIMYCNPHISIDTDTAELRKGFRSPPKSDGKSFSPYTLFNLIKKLETKDGINNWTQLVLELGVEPPDQEKGQSSQKVQQYAVRLKRWLHAFHVGAFFSFLLGKTTSYQTDRPKPTDSVADTVRDSIPPEEDLAVRALLPEWRPKRGRRKAEEIEAEAEAEANSAKRQNIRASSADIASMFDDQYSAAPSSAMPWSAQGTTADAWTAAQVAIAPKTPNSGQTPTSNTLSAHRANPQMSWRYNSNNEIPSSPYPHSAITPRQDFSASPKFDEPKSAHPLTASKSPSRTRKRHTPAVSSAWPSTTSGASGKIRGRPPSNRSVQDGPFSTFPANPTSTTRDIPPGVINTPSSTIAISPATDRQTPPVQQQQQQQQQPNSSLSAPNSSTTSSPNATRSPQQQSQNQNLSQQVPARKPSKLQLQVPAHSGGPVRLATPPRVLINGESSSNQSMSIDPSISSTSSPNTHERRSSADFFSQLDEMFEGRERRSGGSTMDDASSAGRGVGLDEDEGTREDWKRRALVLRRRLAEKEEELKAVKRKVLEAVM